MKKIMILCLVLTLAILVAGCKDNVTGNAVADGSASDYVKIPLADVSKTAQFFSYEDNRVKISYFAVLGSDGKPRVAFDACDVCGGYQGYEQKGNDIECRKCGRVFSIDGLGTKNKGYGCWPSYLPHEVQGDNIMIKISDLQEGRKRFV